MQKTKTKKIRYYLKWILWVIVIQFALANISAAIYAYKFTHFYNPPAPSVSSQNIFVKTWKLFAGPKFYKDTTEAEPQFSFENIQLKTSDGIPIDSWYSQTDSSRACVILIHGYSRNKSYVEDEASMFKLWGYSVLLFDLRGHGRSGGNTTTFGMKETDELQKAFEFAKQKGNSKLIVYGASLGAGICIKATAENKIRPDAIIADIPIGSLHQHFKRRAELLGFPSEPFASLITLWIGLEKGYNAFQHDNRSYAKKVNCPILINAGGRDELISKEETETILKNLPSKNKKLVIYPYANHESLLQKDPFTWEKEVQAFLQSVR